MEATGISRNQIDITGSQGDGIEYEKSQISNRFATAANINLCGFKLLLWMCVCLLFAVGALF